MNRHIAWLLPLCIAASMSLISVAPVRAAEGGLTLASDGKGLSTIYVHPSVMEADRDAPGMKARATEVEMQRRQLRESVKDLALYLGTMSGGKIEVVNAAAPPAAALPAGEAVQILIGDLTTHAYGPPAKPFAYKQGFRVVVDPKTSRVALGGESDLAVSYAIYEILDRLGCRWYIPGAMGEVIPQLKTIRLESMDFSSHPGTIYRGIWYCDAAYQRRNRHGGLKLSAGHALEITGSYLTEQDKQKHPKWLATVGGKPRPSRLKWSNADLANFIGDKIISMHDADPQPSYSLSPDDGGDWDESAEDRALDAGDFDPTFQSTAVTDRLLVFCNRIAKRVTAKQPDALFGMLAYVQYTRPPVREKVDPHVVPQIAPITYSRAHPMNDDRVPGNKDLRHIVEGWAKASDKTSWYFYGWFLAEPVAPNPMIRKWGHDAAYVLREGKCQFWQPETTPNFETSMQALYMGCRLAWDPTLEPDKIIDELNERFYGAASKEMAAYWDFIDRVWVDTPEYSGCGWGYLRRWTPENVRKSRELMNAGLAAARTPAEKYRIGLANDSLTLFEEFMRLRYDLAEGRFAGMDQLGDAWKKRMIALADQYKENFAFTRVSWSPVTMSGAYFESFYEKTYKDAARIMRDFKVVTESPLRKWKFQADPENKGEASGFSNTTFDDSAWKSTDVAAETWSTLGHHDYFGAMWYRSEVTLQEVPAGKKLYLWLGSTDGSAKVFINGKHIPYTGPDAQGKIQTTDQADGYCQPFSFDVTTEMKSGKNTIAILCNRSKIAFNELGSGGLLAAPIIYRQP